MYPSINRGNRDRKFHLGIKGCLGSKQKFASYQTPREMIAVDNFFPTSPTPGRLTGVFAPYSGEFEYKGSVIDSQTRLLVKRGLGVGIGAGVYFCFFSS